MLRGIDISSWQSGIDVASVPCDFVIVKATGGTGYTNPDFKRAADATLAAGKLLGIYHYAREEGCMGSAKDEAQHFLDAFKPYIGKAIPVLDFEAKAQGLPVSWPKEWLDIVAEETGTKPWFYGYASYLNSRDHSALHGYPLWMASYLDEYEYKGHQSNPRQIWPIAGWNYLTCYQYTSKGRLPGYGKDLDLDIFYGDAEDWQAFCGGGGTPAKRKVNVGRVAAAFHADMCLDDDNGYSWEPRHGEDGKPVKKLIIDGKEYQYDRGSWDCSSSVIEAWKEALKYTKYKGRLDGAVTTHNMRQVFRDSGLFEVWDTQSTVAEPGDVYLKDQEHTAMCQPPGTYGGTYYADPLSEFCINENGEVYGGKPGDQTGREAYIHEFYGIWNCTLHYNGKADYEEDEPAPEPTPKPSSTVRFRVKQGGKWQKEGYSGKRGTPIQAIAIDMPGWYQACTARHGWLPRVTGYNTKDDANGYAGWLDSPVIAVRCYYETPDAPPYKYALYRVSDVGGEWWDWQRDNEIDANQDGFAGNFKPIDRFEIKVG